MQRIAILGDSFVSGKVYGIQRFAYEILREVDKLNHGLKIEIVVPTYANIEISFKNIKIIKFGNIRNGFLWRQICFPMYLKKYDAVGVDMTLGLPYLKCDVVCLHDCIYENYASDFKTFKEKIKRLSYIIKASHLAKKSKKIITVSKNSKKEIMQYYHILDDKISIIYNAWQHYLRFSSDNSILERLGLESDKEFYFTLGSGLPHKNLLWIVRAAEQNPTKTFVVTGNNLLSNYIEEIGLKEVANIIFTGYISDGEVKALMENANGFIHPAFCEGFGIPPLEALSCGCEIIISKTSCLPEIYGEAARYIDPYNYEIDMSRIMKMTHGDYQEVLERYSWEQSASAFISVLQSII